MLFLRCRQERQALEGTRPLHCSEEVKPIKTEEFITDPDSQVRELKFSPDGSWLAGLGCRKRRFDDGQECLQVEVLIWDAATHHLVDQFSDQVSPTSTFDFSFNDLVSTMRAFDFSADGQMLATAGCGAWFKDVDCVQGQIVLRGVKSGQQIARLVGGTKVLDSVAFGTNGMLASGSQQGLGFWSIGNERPTSFEHVPTYRVFFSLDGQILVFGNNSPELAVWDIARQQVASWIDTNYARVLTLQTDTKHQRIRAFLDNYPNINQDGVYSWYISNGEQLSQPFLTPGQGDAYMPISAATLILDGTLLATNSCTTRHETVQAQYICDGSEIWIWDIPQ